MVDLLILSLCNSQLVCHVVGEILSGHLYEITHTLGRFASDGVESLYCELNQCNLERERGGKEGRREGGGNDEKRSEMEKGEREIEIILCTCRVASVCSPFLPACPSPQSGLLGRTVSRVGKKRGYRHTYTCKNMHKTTQIMHIHQETCYLPQEQYMYLT